MLHVPTFFLFFLSDIVFGFFSYLSPLYYNKLFFTNIPSIFLYNSNSDYNATEDDDDSKKCVSSYPNDNCSFEEKSFLQSQAQKARLAVPPLVPIIVPTAIPYLDPKSPRCRLSRPGSSTVRVIPPLRGLEREVCCVHCGGRLFCLANVLRIQDAKLLQHGHTSDNNTHNNPQNDHNAQNKRQSTPTASSSSSPSGLLTPTFPQLLPQLMDARDTKNYSPFNSKDPKFDFRDLTTNCKIDIKQDIKQDMKQDLKRDLKRDCEGEHKQEQKDRTVLPYISSGYPDQKGPQSVRGGGKKFDFEFEKPSGPLSVKHSNSRHSGGFKVGFEEGILENQRLSLGKYCSCSRC